MSAAETPQAGENLAVVWTGARQLAIQPRPVRDPGPGEVQVRLVSTGICGSDLHNWTSASLSRPLVLGHESAGVITQIGPTTTTTATTTPSLNIGDRVAVEPGFPCARCEFCLRGNPNTCADLRYCGLDPTDGTLCRLFTCRAEMAVPIPDGVSWEEAGCVQPLAIAVQLARRAALGPHQTLAIFGCGPLGLLTLAVAKAYGVKKIVMFDIEEGRVEFARSYGADVGIVAPTSFTPTEDKTSFDLVQDYARKVIADYGLAYGFDIAVEASGAEICAQMAVCVLKAGGTCIQAGLGKPLTAVPLYLLTAKELNIKGTVRYTPGCFADAISLLSRKLVDLKPLITSTFPLTEAAKAFEAQHARKDIKIVIMNQE